MEVEVKSITKHSGKIRNGKNKGNNYEMFLITFGEANMFACGGLNRGFTWPVYGSRDSDKAIFSALDEIERESTDQEGIENLPMEKIEEAIEKWAESPVPRKKKLARGFFTFDTDLYDPKTGAPQHNCMRFASKYMLIGNEGEEWIRVNTDGQHVTRTIRGAEVPVVNTHDTVYWQERYDMPSETWLPVDGSATAEEAATKAMADMRERMYIPNAASSTLDLNLVDEDAKNAENAEGGADASEQG